MYCDRCGNKLSDATVFCPACGKSAGTTPSMPQQGRIAGHVRLLGILWLAISAFRVIPGWRSDLCDFDRAPTFCTCALPPLNRISVGMPRMPN